MRLEHLETANKLLPDLTEAERKLRCAQTMTKLHILEGVGRELQDYQPPSNIGVAFRKIKAALIELHEKELEGVKGAMRAFGVEI